MKQNFSLRQMGVLLTVCLLLALPSLLAGGLDLDSASRFLAAGDSPAAADAFARAARRLPWRADLWEQAGMAAWQAGDPEQAIRWFAEAESRRALSRDGWLTYGDAFQTLGDVETAVSVWQRGEAAFGPSAETARRLAVVSRRQGDFEAALFHLQQAVALAPGEAGMHYELGLLLAALRPEEALPELMQAAALDAAFDPAVQTLRAELNRAFLVDEPAYHWLTSGRALAALGHWDLAAEAFRRAVEADEDYAEAWAWLGEARQQTGLDGRPQLEHALSLAPDSASVQALYGLYWLRQGKPEQAMEACATAAALEPENPAWHVALGDAASAAGKFVQAVEAYQRAVELDPDYLAAWRGLALVSVNNGADIEGVGRFAARQLLRLAPDDWFTYDIAGRMALLVGARDEAEKHLLKAIELAPDQPGPHLHLALVYLEFGEMTAAYDKLVDARQLDPGGAFGWQAQRLLEQYFP